MQKECVKFSWRTKPEDHNTQYLEAMAAYHFIRGYVRGKRVLDAGCAYGYGTHELAQEALEAVGIDFCEEAITYAKEHYQMPTIRFMVGDITDLSLTQASFDALCLFEVLHVAHKPVLILSQARRVLTPGGLLLVSVRRGGDDSGVFQEGALSHPFSAQGWKKVFSRYGFEVLEVWGIGRPKDMFALEGELKKWRAWDILGLRKIVPRTLISSLVRRISLHKGITPPQQLTYNDFPVSRDEVDGSPGNIFIATKIGKEE